MTKQRLICLFALTVFLAAFAMPPGTVTRPGAIYAGLSPTAEPTPPTPGLIAGQSLAPCVGESTLLTNTLFFPFVGGGVSAPGGTVPAFTH